jgi:hypothetical protein
MKLSSDNAKIEQSEQAASEPPPEPFEQEHRCRKEQDDL